MTSRSTDDDADSSPDAEGARTHGSDPTSPSGVRPRGSEDAAPAITAETPRFRSGLLALLPLLVAVVAGVIAYARLPEVSRRTVWAEDGAVFLSQIDTEGVVATLFRPYDGYLHVIPRLVADLVSLAPIEKWALGLTIGSCAIAAAVSALVFVLSGSLLTWLPARLAVALLTVLTPALPIEVLGNAANLHWYFLWAAPWIALATAKTRAGSIALGAVTLLMTLTEIQMVLFAPLLLLRLRERRSWPVGVGFAVGGLAQIAVALSHPRERAPLSIDVSVTVWGFLTNETSLVSGSGALTGALVARWGLLVPTLVVVAFVLAGAYAFWRGDRRIRVLVTALAVGAPVLYAAAVTVNPNPAFSYDSWTIEQWAAFEYLRYAVVPAMMLGALPFVAASVAARRGRRFIPWAIIGGGLVVATLAFFPSSTSRNAGPVWENGVRNAESVCGQANRPHPDVVDIALAPVGWGARFTCDYVEQN